MWDIKKLVKKGEYLYAVVPEHPYAIKYGYVLHHRVVMENFLGRVLSFTEVIHHIDGNKHNNDILNLEIMTSNEHSKHHSLKGRTCINLVCPECGKNFQKEKRLMKPEVTHPKCSRRCNGLQSRKLQMSKLKSREVK